MSQMSQPYKQAKGTYPSLKTGESILLDKRSSYPVNMLQMGLGWEPILRPEQVGFGAKHFKWISKLPYICDYEPIAKRFRDDSVVDLDASSLSFDDQNELLEAIFYRNLISGDGSIRHSGDCLFGEDEGDDETVFIELNKVGPNVRSIVFSITSYSGQTFDLLSNSYCRVVDTQSHKELARVRLSTKGRFSALILARLLRTNKGWVFQALNEPSNGATYEDILPEIKRVLTSMDTLSDTAPLSIWDTI